MTQPVAVPKGEPSEKVKIIASILLENGGEDIGYQVKRYGW